MCFYQTSSTALFTPSFPDRVESQRQQSPTNSDQASKQVPLPPPKLIVIGASAIDITARVADSPTSKQAQVSQTTAPGNVTLTVGGVARNIAEAAHRVLSSVGSVSETMLLSPVGDDEFAPFLLDEMERIGMRADGMIREGEGRRTAVCNMVLDASGALIGGVADMDIVANVDEASVWFCSLSSTGFVGLMCLATQIARCLKENKPSLVVMDGNMSSPTLTHVLNICNQHSIPSKSQSDA